MKAKRIQLHLLILLPKQKTQKIYDTTQMLKYVFIRDIKKEPS